MTLKAIPQRPLLYYELMTSDNLEICSECNGTGVNPEYAELNLDLFNVQLSFGRYYNEIIYISCSKCYGHGYIDWIDNIRGIQGRIDYDLLTELRWNCIEFLLMLLSGSPKEYVEGSHYESGIHVVYGWDIDVEQGLIDFNKHKSVVSKYLDEGNKNWINAQINKSMVVQGKACTNCLKLVPDKVLIERCNKTLKLLPAIPGDEINYQNFIVPDRNFPLFRLCDTCNAKLNQYEIEKLKDAAFYKDYNRNMIPEFFNKNGTYYDIDNFI